MTQRGRKSAAALTLSTITGPLETIPRPDAPYDLSDEEVEEWRAVTERLPATWFPRETHGLLTQYCRHIVRARRIAQIIRTMENPPKPKKGEEKAEFDIDAYNKLLIMQERESRSISHLAVKMRIAQQSTIDKEAKKAGVGVRPWEQE
jgi:hypothetical protein